LIIALKNAEDIFRIKVGHRKAARADPMLSVNTAWASAGYTSLGE